MNGEFVMNASGKAELTVGKYRIEYDRIEHRFSVFGSDGVCISTHGHIKDALDAAKRYRAGDKRRAT
jgi:hypothetical protein